ncbi:conserved protein, unknown function [Hepatocystis sp. ex Piliocolobus tephrosceles]|nr:conserved protein, unknown function [Hepatocystis sp. ex Piliocolobus tephrosceles]
MGKNRQKCQKNKNNVDNTHLNNKPSLWSRLINKEKNFFDKAFEENLANFQKLSLKDEDNCVVQEEELTEENNSQTLEKKFEKLNNKRKKKKKRKLKMIKNTKRKYFVNELTIYTYTISYNLSNTLNSRKEERKENILNE